MAHIVASSNRLQLLCGKVGLCYLGLARETSLCEFSGGEEKTIGQVPSANDNVALCIIQQGKGSVTKPIDN